jgi:glycosyltransferase involved in cell wall biosynthesis
MPALQSPLAGSLRFALVAPSAESIVALRDGLVLEAIARRHRVLCITPPAKSRSVHALRDLGAQHRAVEMDFPRIPFLADWQLTKQLVDVFRDWQPEVAMGFGLRPMVDTAIAARRAKVKRVVSLCNGLPREGVDGIGQRRFAHAMRASDAVIFHNQDDRRLLSAAGLIPKGLQSIVVPGAGVDLRRYPAKPLPPYADGIVFLMIGRLERSRGVMEYALAARDLKGRNPGARFLLAGPLGKGPDGVSLDALAAAGGALEYQGSLDDVRKTLASCHVFVYPSHAEGMPLAVLEALATGRPVITTDTPGCRETVDDMVSGCLVPAGDAKALAAAMDSFLKHPDVISATSRAARLKAERRFDRANVNRTLFEVLGL